MNPELWTNVDDYLASNLLREDRVLESVLRASDAAGLPAIQVSATQGKLLNLLARMANARRILEIGTLGGYSTIWMARALPPQGRLITLELEPRHADLAERNFAEAGISSTIELRRGRAIDSLAQLEREGVSDFDLTFIDADKQSCAEYFNWAVRHTRLGGTIVVDNVVRNGAVLDERSADEGVLGVRRFLAAVREDRRVDATALQTVGAKGYDGVALAVVISR
jgi:predicted O-methyltransferase YrrM